MLSFSRSDSLGAFLPTLEMCRTILCKYRYTSPSNFQASMKLIITRNVSMQNYTVSCTYHVVIHLRQWNWNRSSPSSFALNKSYDKVATRINTKHTNALTYNLERLHEDRISKMLVNRADNFSIVCKTLMKQQ